jgi:hypothetical protein
MIEHLTAAERRVLQVVAGAGRRVTLADVVDGAAVDDAQARSILAHLRRRELVSADLGPSWAITALGRRAGDELQAAGAGGGLDADDAAWRLEQMRDALEFYADHASYERVTRGDAHPAGVDVGDPRVLADRGARARAALRGLEGRPTITGLGGDR